MQNHKKILIFSTSYLPFVGGAEVSVKEITDRISDWEFDMITAKFKRNLPKFERVGNINVYRIGFGISTLDKLLLPFWGALKTISLNKKNNYDLFWCIMASFGSGAAYMANILRFWDKVPVVLTLQEGDSEKHLQRRWFGLINLSWKLALNRSAYLTAISSYLAERAKHLGYAGKLAVVPNGVDVKKFDIVLSDEERVRTKKRLGLNDEDVALITASRLVVKNGMEDVIKALPLLPKNFKFIILGEGDLERKLKELSKSLGVADRIIFKGHVPNEEIPENLKAADIFIRPSLSEGMGNSFIEAMACSIPVIGTAVGGIPDFLKEGETGYLCEPRNPESIARAVERVMNDPDKAEITKRACDLARSKYDWRDISNRMDDVFDKTIKNEK